MNVADLSLRDFESALASSEPTPGGGTAAAVALGQAAALTSMVASLTLGSERWADGHDAARRALEEAKQVRRDALDLGDEDALAFDAVMDSFRLPKDTDEQKAARRAAIRAATLHAAEVPMRTAERARALLDHVHAMVQHGNPNAVSDAGMASLLASAAAKGAVFNVQINLDALPLDHGVDLRARLPLLQEDVRLLGRQCMEGVRLRMDAQRT
jgi:formiminotetrahydrofolate cyclodeaminase